VTSCSLVEGHKCFGEPYCLHQGETLVSDHIIRKHHNLKDHDFILRRCWRHQITQIRQSASIFIKYIPKFQYNSLNHFKSNQ